MVAVLTVFANHLWAWPRGGFIGVDVFFVISGFLITGNLLRTAETTGNVSFRGFYWNRIRRIVPAATVVLILTYAASLLVFLPFRSHQIGVDALFAFVFLSNWWFAIQGTDYFASGNAVSPIQHYWSLSIEEQFYFVWPALIFIISVIVIRRGWTHAHRMQLAGGVMGVIVAASLGWALFETTTFAAWAYFSSLTRAWELGVGALLATAIGVLARIPTVLKPLLSWTGLGLIAASLFLIHDGAVGFPAPWALLPVTGAALVIAAGVGGEPKYQAILRHPVSTYIGDFSYSLYLVHWPVIVILGALIDPSLYFDAMVVALAFGLAIASYHFVENPLRRADGNKFREAIRDIRTRRYQPKRSSHYAAVGSLTLLILALLAYGMSPDVFQRETPPPTTAVAAADDLSPPEPQRGPLESALHDEIVAALKATEWPPLDPSMESVIEADGMPSIDRCADTEPRRPEECTWGAPSAPIRVVLVGDSLAVKYAGPLRELALNSGDRMQLHLEAMAGCQFSNDWIYNEDKSITDACPARKQHTVDYINATKPDIVIISDSYGVKNRVGSDQAMTPGEWGDALRLIVDQFRSSTKKVVFLSPPPADKNVSECYGSRSSVPADCISKVDTQWLSIARAERNVAESIGGVWIDSRPWFCNEGLCPAFVGSTPTKHDRAHMSLAYAERIYPVIGESFAAAGVF